MSLGQNCTQSVTFQGFNAKADDPKQLTHRIRCVAEPISIVAVIIRFKKVSKKSFLCAAFSMSAPVSIAQCVHCTVFFPLDRARSDLS